MEIETMRRGNYPGSEIVIERELERGVNYRRYYAWYSSEGLKIYGLLTIPLMQMPEGGYPALVFLHGYIAPAAYRTTERYLAYTDWLSRNGYVVYKVDLRGHDRSEGIANGAYSTPGYTIDVLNAVASLQQHPQVNPDKIGMWGHSMGGFLTLRAMVISKQIKVGVIWAGLVCDYPDMFYRWRPVTASSTPSPATRGWRAEWIQKYGTPEDSPAFWSAVSANSYLADISGPVQLHHGTKDTSVPLVFSEELAVDVKDAGGTAEIYVYDGDNHNLSNSFITAMTRTVKYFDEYLK
jgi:dipeptidyl aminopeptidase/acylaminoacyl peptidase